MAQQAPYASSASRPSRPPAAWRSPRSKPVEHLWRGLSARFREFPTNPHFDLDRTLSVFRGSEDFEVLDAVVKTAMQPASTLTSGWLSEIVGVVVAQWDSQLAPVSAFAQLRAQSLALSSPAGGLLRVLGRDVSPKVNGSFVGEANPIPARRFNVTSNVLLPHRMAVISVFTRELAKGSPLDVEAVIKQEVLADTAGALDAVLLDAVAADALRPAGLRNGLTGLTPSAAATYSEKVLLTFARCLPQSRLRAGSRWLFIRCRRQASRLPSLSRAPRSPSSLPHPPRRAH